LGMGQISLSNSTNSRVSLNADTTVDSLTSGMTNGTYALNFSGGGGSGVAGTATVAGNLITAVTITNYGRDFTSAPTIALTAAGGTGSITTTFGSSTINLNPGTARKLTISGTNANPATFAGVISGSNGRLVKDGTGTRILSGINTYTGTTTINAGSLVVNGSLAAASTVTVGASGTLGGNGIVNGSVTAAGTIAPGASAGTLTTGAATLTGILAVEIDGATSDKLLSTGVLNITGAHLTVSLLAGGFSQSSYVIAEGTSLTGTFASVPSGYNVSYSATRATLMQSAVVSNYASWATTNGISGQPASGDFDKDGVTNLVEYALGKNPTVSSQPAGTLSGNALTFIKGSGAIANGDVNFVIEESTNLVTWAPVVTQNAPNASPTISYTLPTGQPKTFARLKVVQTP